MIANELGAFCSRLTFRELPAEVVAAIKYRTLDTFSAAIAGLRLGSHRQLLAVMSGPGAATIWGDGAKLPLRDAVLINSFLSHCTYMDDGDRYSGAHPGAVVIPSAVALAEIRQANGAALITAISAGYEALLRIGQAIYPSAVLRGFQSTAILGSIGAAAACANLLRLSPEATKNAIGLACNLGSGLKEALKCPSTQPLQVARASEGGLLAALYAQQGAEAPDGIIENGFVKAFADRFDTTKILSELGSHYRLCDTYIKVHGGCRGNHSPTDAVIELMRTRSIAPEDIEQIVVSVDTVTMAGEISNPENAEQAQFCIPFAIAVAILAGNASIFQFSDDNLNDPQLRNLMHKISVNLDKSLDDSYPDKRGAVAEILTKSGHSERLAVENARGEPEFPLAPNDILMKFESLALPVLGIGCERTWQAVMRLDQIPDLTELLACLSPLRADRQN